MFESPEQKQSTKKQENLSSKTRAFREVHKLAQSADMESAVDKFFVICDIQPEYIQAKENPDKSSEMRRKLQTESGVVISNHPGIIDILFILKAIGNRTDVKIFSAQQVAKMYGELFGQENAITIGDLDYEEKMLSHIKSGGLMIFMPTAGEERNSREIKFKRGFGNIFVQKLNPDCMVYNFYVNPKDIEEIIGETTFKNYSEPNPKRDTLFSRFNRVISDSKESAGLIHGEPAPVRVYERYSQIKDWQALGSNDPEVLTDYYIKMLGISKNIDSK